MSNQNQLAIIKKDVIDVVAKRVQEFQQSGELQLPADYSAANAMKSAFLMLQDVVDRNKAPALEVCTQNSIANALLSMVVQGLNPAKKQLYFLVYGKTLSCQRSYFGAMSVAKMVDPTIGAFPAEVIYEKDVLKYEIVRGQKVVTKHEQEFGNIDKTKIIGAYCMVIGTDGETKSTTLMTMAEIKQSWKQSKVKPVDDKGNIKADSTHGKFTADMSLRTVINKACKPIINSSSDATILGKIIHEAAAIVVEAELAEDIDENANKIAIDIQPEPEEAPPIVETVKKTLAPPEPELKEKQEAVSPADDDNPFADEGGVAGSGCGF